MGDVKTSKQYPREREIVLLPLADSIIIIPTYNEIDNIGPMVETIFGLYKDISLLIIDDASPDGTAKKVKELQRAHPQLCLLERKGKLGLGTAYVKGFQWALTKDFDYIFSMDCDFSHDPKYISDLLHEAQRFDLDLVIGSRYIDGIRVINWPFKKLFLSYLASFFIRFLMGMSINDTTSGFKCFTRKALDTLNLDKVFSKNYAFQLEVHYKLWIKELNIKEVPIIFYERKKGRSKMNFSIIIEGILTVFYLKWKKIWGTL